MHLCCLSQSRHCLMFFASLPPYSVMFQQRRSNSLLQLCEICVTLLYFSSLFLSIRFLRAFPFRIDFGVCLFVYCVVCPLPPPYLSVVAHFVFSCCFTLALAYFSLFVLSIGYSPQFLWWCVLLPLIHLQITCKTSYGPRTWHNYCVIIVSNTFRNISTYI